MASSGIERGEAPPGRTTSGMLALYQVLREIPAPAPGILSAYTDISADPSIGEAYLLAFCERVKTIRDELPDAERVSFGAAARRIQDVIVQSLAVVPLRKQQEETTDVSDAPGSTPLVTRPGDAERVALGSEWQPRPHPG